MKRKQPASNSTFDPTNKENPFKQVRLHPNLSIDLLCSADDGGNVTLGSSSSPTKETRMAHWKDGRLLRTLCPDLQHYILDLWLPLHWFTTFRDRMKDLRNIGYFDTRVYFRRKSHTTNNWFVDHADMQIQQERDEELKRTGYTQTQSPRHLGHPQMECTQPTVGRLESALWIRKYDKRLKRASWDVRPWFVDPRTFSAKIKLYPRKKRKLSSELNEELRVRAVWECIIWCSWVGVKEHGGIGGTGRTSSYVIRSFKAKNTLELGPIDDNSGWEIRYGGCHEEVGCPEIVVPLDLLTYLYNNDTSMKAVTRSKIRAKK